MELRQSTSRMIKVGMAVNSTGVTPVTNLTIDAADQAEILKEGTTATQAISGTLTAITNCDGWYNLTLADTETSAIGNLTVVINDASLILPIWRDYSIVEQGYYDTKYNSTGSFKASLTSAEYTTATSFHATGFSTFDPATDGVTLGSAAYASIGAFHASVTGYSTFNPASTGVTLGSATYTTVTSFHASGFSTFDPASDGVSLSSAVYTSIGAFRLPVSDIISGISDGAYDLLEMQRIMFAVLAGKVSGGSTTTISIRNSADTKNRVVATVDANGNRTAMTLDGS